MIEFTTKEATMATSAIAQPTRAADDMAEQASILDGHAYNLERIWRACGSPKGRDPRRWGSRDMAGALIQGTAVYFANRDRESGMRASLRSEGLVDEVFFDLISNPKPGVDWRIGDKLGTHTIARAYAEYLDQSDAEG